MTCVPVCMARCGEACGTQKAIGEQHPGFEKLPIKLGSTSPPSLSSRRPQIALHDLRSGSPTSRVMPLHGPLKLPDTPLSEVVTVRGAHQ